VNHLWDLRRIHVTRNYQQYLYMASISCVRCRHSSKEIHSFISNTSCVPAKATHNDGCIGARPQARENKYDEQKKVRCGPACCPAHSLIIPPVAIATESSLIAMLPSTVYALLLLRNAVQNRHGVLHCSMPFAVESLWSHSRGQVGPEFPADVHYMLPNAQDVQLTDG
jgi:hypothetical protein